MVKTAAELEACIGKTPGAIHLKVIDHLDAGALRWLAQSPLMFAGFGDGEGIGVTPGGGERGFASGEAHELRLPCARLDRPALARPGAAFGALFLLPGVGETLRVNGVVSAVDGAEVRIAVNECYGHCAKALIRSAFWAASPDSATPGDVPTFVAAGRFLALATFDGGGNADLSPKGDPAGTMIQFDEDGRLWFADRPGNRRVDSFRNILVQPRIAAALLIPGSNHIASFTGTAQIPTDMSARTRLTVQDKIPAIATCIEDLQIELYASPALARASLWPAEARPADIDPARLFVDHVKLNKDKGLQARLIGGLASIPGLMQKNLDLDYKTNLY